MISLLATLLALTASSSALAMPQATTGKPGIEPYPNSTKIGYYQEEMETCGIQVAAGVIEAGVCTRFLTQAVQIEQVRNGSCSLTMYRGSDTCDGGSRVVHPLENGDGVACFETGVLDGGKWYHGSGIWMCG